MTCLHLKVRKQTQVSVWAGQRMGVPNPDQRVLSPPPPFSCAFSIFLAIHTLKNKTHGAN